MIVRYAFALLLSLSVTPLLAQSQIELTPNQMRNAAAAAIVNGQSQVGYQLSGALLTRDPNDTEALIIRARAARDLGFLDEALTLARRGWQQAATPSERFGASMVMAQALSTKGARTRAQFWLRRATQNAPNPEMRAVAIRDFQFVRANNRWSTEFGFSISPSSNINNGSRRSTTRLFDLPFEFQLSPAAQALSGLQYSANFATRYRLSENARGQNDLAFSASHRTYTVSPETRRLAPNVRGSDFAFTTLGISWINRGFSSRGTNLPYQFDVTFGETWYAQQPFMSYTKFGFTQNVRISDTAFAFGGASFEQQNSTSNRSDVSISGLNAGVRMTRPNRDLVTLTISGQRSISQDASLDYFQGTAGVKYAFAKPFLGMKFDIGLSVSNKSHERSRFTALGRQDQSVSADITAVFQNIQYFGFSPSVTLSARQTNSTIGLFDTTDFGMNIGIRSSF